MEKLYGYWMHLIKILLKNDWLECILLQCKFCTLWTSILDKSLHAHGASINKLLIICTREVLNIVENKV